MNIIRRIVGWALLFAPFSACGYVNYSELYEGEFSGSLFVMWVTENETGSGDGKFVFVPNPRNPLIFTRRNPDATLTTIQPGMMYTDGGSIPRPTQFFRGFSPWGYAPAYMVHDWLFVARHCITDNDARPEELPVAKMSFQESAEVIGEAIKTLIAAGKVQGNDVAPSVISGAVAGPISYRRWVIEGACHDDRVTPKHEAEARSGIPGTLRSQKGIRVETLSDGSRAKVSPAQFVTEISFD